MMRLSGIETDLHAATTFLPANDKTMPQAGGPDLVIKDHRQADSKTGRGQHTVVKMKDHGAGDSIVKNGPRNVWVTPTLMGRHLLSEGTGAVTLHSLLESLCATGLIEVGAPLDQHDHSGNAMKRPHTRANGLPENRMTASGAVMRPEMVLRGLSKQPTSMNQREGQSHFRTLLQLPNSSTDTLVYSQC